jgi:hypothetical protein
VSGRATDAASGVAYDDLLDRMLAGQLAVDVQQARRDRRLADEQPRRRLPAGRAPGHQAEHLQLPVARRLQRRPPDPAHQAARHRWRQHLLSLVRRPHGPHEGVARRVLEHAVHRRPLAVSLAQVLEFDDWRGNQDRRATGRAESTAQLEIHQPFG